MITTQVNHFQNKAIQFSITQLPNSLFFNSYLINKFLRLKNEKCFLVLYYSNHNQVVFLLTSVKINEKKNIGLLKLNLFTTINPYRKKKYEIKFKFLKNFLRPL